jgi:hypothetical protein
MSTVIDGADELSTWPVSCRATTGRPPSVPVIRRRDLPLDLWRDLGHTTEYFALEVLDDFGAPTRPLLCRDDFATVRQRQDVGQLRERIRLGLVVVRVIGILLVAARTRTQRRDAELLHHLRWSSAAVQFFGSSVGRCCARRNKGAANARTATQPADLQ